MTWLNMLFVPEDVFEVRVKEQNDRGAIQIWYNMRQKGKFFAETAAPIHVANHRHVWVGVAPRTNPRSTAAKLLRALWVDLNGTITDISQVHKLLETPAVPKPTMIVNSGNGFHLYWKLTEPINADVARKWTKGIHAEFPTDATHDPTRIMRVPGTLNVKDPENPKPCFIEEYHPERAYHPNDMPQVHVNIAQHITRTSRRLITPADRQLFVTNWLDGQKHTMAVGVAGYLRKELGYTQDDTMQEIELIHRLAGYQMDDNLRDVVIHTYEKPFAVVGGLSILNDLGVFPEGVSHFRLVVKPTSKPKGTIKILDFNQTMKKQEFWIPGLVGPGLLAIWGAEPKTGKSIVAMQMGYSLATGTQFFDFPLTTDPKKVLYFQGELTGAMVMERATKLWGDKIIRDPKQFALTDRPDKPLDLVRNPEVLLVVAEDYDVIIVDPISVFHQNDENSIHSVNEVFGVFDSLRNAGKSVIIVHHLRKLQSDRKGNSITPSFNDLRGAGAWFASADALAIQYKHGETNRVKFSFRAAPDRPELVMYRKDPLGFTIDKNEWLEQQAKKGIEVAINV